MVISRVMLVRHAMDLHTRRLEFAVQRRRQPNGQQQERSDPG